MARFDPRQPDALPHAGTFNNNVLTMAAGIAALSEVYTPEAAKALNATGEALRSRLNEVATQARRGMLFTGIGSMLRGAHAALAAARPGGGGEGRHEGARPVLLRHAEGRHLARPAGHDVAVSAADRPPITTRSSARWRSSCRPAGICCTDSFASSRPLPLWGGLG